MRPYIGEVEPSLERVERRVCGFKPILIVGLPAGERCEQDADLHLLVRHPEHGTLHELLSCLWHFTTAAQTGQLVGSHDIGESCARPGTHYDQVHDRCLPCVLEEMS